MSLPQAYIVAALRTAGARRKGRLANVHPADLAASKEAASLNVTIVERL